jgi:hypothetical protein
MYMLAIFYGRQVAAQNLHEEDRSRVPVPQGASPAGEVPAWLSSGVGRTDLAKALRQNYDEGGNQSCQEPNRLLG